MTFEEFVAYWSKLGRWADFKHQREGQRLINCLDQINPALYHNVPSKLSDAFYDDSQIPTLLEWLGARWNPDTAHMDPHVDGGDK